MRYSISDTAEYGDLTRGPRRHRRGHARPPCAACWPTSSSGAFAREWILENQAGRPVFNALQRQGKEHQIEVVGKKLRGMMSWIERGRPRHRRLSGEPHRSPALRHRETMELTSPVVTAGAGGAAQPPRPLQPAPHSHTEAPLRLRPARLQPRLTIARSCRGAPLPRRSDGAEEAAKRPSALTPPRRLATMAPRTFRSHGSPVAAPRRPNLSERTTRC